MNRNDFEDRIGFNRAIWWTVQTFIETGEAYLTHRNVTWVLKASRMLRLKELEKQCHRYLDFLCRKHSPLCVYVAARRYGQEEMSKAGLKSIRAQFATLATSDEFTHLPVDYLTAILTDSYLSIKREMVVFEAAYRWLSADWLERFHHSVPVLRCVRFRLMSEEDLAELSVCADYRAIFGITENLRMLHEAILYVLSVKHATIAKHRLLPPVPRFYF